VDEARSILKHGWALATVVNSAAHVFILLGSIITDFP
jgi:hypothetical protein